jgi:hypothetical protein
VSLASPGHRRPGTEINPLDNYYTVPALADSRLSRR